MYETIRYEVKERGAYLTLNRPEVLNSFNAAMNREIIDALKRAERDPEVGCVIITGEGRAFCAGEDLAGVRQGAVDYGETLRKRYNPMVLAIRRLEKPVIAAVNGVAAGAGCSMALACDLRIAAQGASFIEAFAAIGLVPDSGSCYFLPRLIGLGRTMEMVFTGGKISASQALEWGLVNHVIPQEEFASFVQAYGEKLAKGATKAMGLMKRAIYRGLSQTLEEALEEEAYAQEIAGRSEDHREGVAAFFDKRTAVFRGR